MKAKLIGLLSIVFVFSGCNKIDPVKITAANVNISKKSDGTFSSGKSILLSENSTKFVQDWLNNHRTGWHTYNPSPYPQLFDAAQYLSGISKIP